MNYKSVLLKMFETIKKDKDHSLLRSLRKNFCGFCVEKTLARFAWDYIPRKDRKGVAGFAWYIF